MTTHCECETITLNQPSPWDPYQPDEQRIPNPLCPIHNQQDDDRGVDWSECAEFYNLAITNDGEWIEEDDWDPETGDRKES